MRPLTIIADEIRADWKNVNAMALPYLSAMETLCSLNDKFYNDSAESIVAYFLSNAASWRGTKAREIKKELNDMLKEHKYQKFSRQLKGERK